MIGSIQFLFEGISYKKEFLASSFSKIGIPTPKFES